MIMSLCLKNAGVDLIMFLKLSACVHVYVGATKNYIFYIFTFFAKGSGPPARLGLTRVGKS